jgi:hypothetical protein
MIDNNEVSTESISVDIGDLRVDFIGSPSYAKPKLVSNSPIHRHYYFEFKYTVSGTSFVNVSNEENLEVAQDSFLLIPPQMPHSNSCQPSKRLVLSFALQKIRHKHKSTFSEFSHYSMLFKSIHRHLLINDSVISACVHKLIQLAPIPENIHKQRILLTLLFIPITPLVAYHNTFHYFKQMSN